MSDAKGILENQKRIIEIVSVSFIFLILVSFLIITPDYFLNTPKNENFSQIVGHTFEHDETISDCGIVDKNPIKKVTLVAQQVLWEVAPGKSFQAWTYNGTIPGPAICVNEGDTLTVELQNRISTIIAFHTHGLKREYSSDGTYMSRSFAVPGGSYTYTLEADNLSVGTWAYHDAVAGLDEELFFQNRTIPESGEGIERGLFGALIVYGKDEPSNIDHEVILVESEFESEVTLGATYMTFNGKISPVTPTYQFKKNEVIRFRILNVGPNANHDIYIEGFEWFDTITKKPTKNVLFGALEFGDYTVNASSLADTIYYCAIPDHIEQGMIGKFIITD